MNTKAPKVWLFRLVSLERLVDGDTFFARVERPVDVGFGRLARWSTVEEFRLALGLKAGVDCPEVHGATKAMGELAAQRTLQLLSQWLFENPERCQLVSWGRDDKYGRWLADVRVISTTAEDLIAAEVGEGEWSPGVEMSGVLASLAQQLVDDGFALEYDGRGPRPHWNPAAAYPLAKGGA